jgi:EH domain-containing protein 1
MWSLGKVFNTPEVVKVYVGSFNAPGGASSGNAGKGALGEMLFAKEQADLLRDLTEIPSRACDRKVNEFVKRVRAARTHMILTGSLRKQMPMTYGFEEKQKKLLGRLEKEFEKCQVEFMLPRGDMPNVDRYRTMLASHDFMKFPKLEQRNVEIMEGVLKQDLPAIMKQFENPF